MRTLPALLTALSVGVAGCSFSSVDPDADVSVSGRALDASGKPLAGTEVLLFRQADIGQVVFGSVLAVGSLGTICLLPDPPALCSRAERAKTDQDGRYRFHLKGSDTQGSLGTEATLNVVFSAPEGGGTTTVSFAAKETDVALPDARLWRSSAKVSQASGKIRLSWAGLPGAAGRKPSYSAELFEGTSSSALWSQPASGHAAGIDPRILEDRSGAVAVSANAALSGGSGAGKVRANFLSPRLRVRPSAGAPPSRDRRCAAVTGTAPAKDAKLGSCAATDGDLHTAARPSGGAGGVVTGAVVDLGSVRPVSLVVGRGFAGQVVAETSSDGRTWTTVATSTGSAVALSVPGNRTARYVRLRSPAGLDESLASELSVW